MKLNKTLILVILSILFISSNSHASLGKKGRGKAKIEIGAFQYGAGAMLTVTGKAAQKLFEEITFRGEDVDQAGDNVYQNAPPEMISTSDDIEVKQTKNLQCVRKSKRYTCKIFIRENGVVGDIPQLYL